MRIHKIVSENGNEKKNKKTGSYFFFNRFMSDQEAWHELCNLYLAEGEFSKATFCMEELLLHNPHSHLYHQRLAEIRYTMVSTEFYMLISLKLIIIISLEIVLFLFYLQTGRPRQL